MKLKCHACMQQLRYFGAALFELRVENDLSDGEHDSTNVKNKLSPL